MKLLFLFLASTLLLSGAESYLTLPKFFHNDMVLQQQPLTAHLWGITNDSSTVLTCEVSNCKSGFVGIYDGAVMGKEFSVDIGPVPEGDICDVTLTQGPHQIVLTNVLFGDVWICSGQSNMEWSMGQIFNSSEEISNSAEYTNIRMYKVKHMTSEFEEDDLLEEDWDSWSDASDPARLGGFSAVCFLFARTVSERFEPRPFGLIEANWGGTRIEPWSPPESLNKCGIPDNVDPDKPQNSNSYLYNAMIHPFIRMSIKGALWYQGEANRVWNAPFYSCTFPEMINAWRQRWSSNSATSPSFPFGFAQLAPFNAASNTYEFPEMRWHQTAGFGFAPNALMQDVFMAVTIDTYDEESGIHPRNKQVVGDRLAIAGLNVAYGMSTFRTNGPFPTSIDLADTGDALVAEITYNQAFAYNPVENSGFYKCSQPTFDECSVTNSWQLVDVAAVEQAQPDTVKVTLTKDTPVIGLAYLWKESPILGTKAAPIYSQDEFQLPGGPWAQEVSQSP